MTTTPSNGHPGDSLPSERNKKTASGKRRRGDLDFIASVADQNAIAERAEETSEPQGDHRAASSTPTEAKSLDHDSRPQEASGSGPEQTHLPRAFQLLPIPGLLPIDLPLSAQIEKTAAIQQLALARMRAAQGGATERPPATPQTDRDAAPPLMGCPKVDQFSTKGQAVKQSDDGMAAAKAARKFRGPILVASVLAIAAAGVWISGGSPSLDVPGITRMAYSYIHVRAPSVQQKHEAAPSQAVQPAVLAESGKSPHSAVPQSHNSSDGETAAMAQLTSDERAAADKGEQLIANAEQYSRVSAKSEQPAQRAEAPAKQMSPMREAVATLQPNTPPFLNRSSRYLDPQEVKVLITRGEQLMATGDVVAARGMFLRAAESEDPHAALVLGATYDPNVLVRLGVIGIAANLEKARGWYERAETWGSLEARRRLELLNR